MTKFKKYGWLVVFATAITRIHCELETIDPGCPEYCQCDVYENFNRAVCQNQVLVTLYLDIPSGVDILDVSYNHINELNNNIFLETGLTHLKLLNISHNKISTMHLNSFIGLDGLKTLDLSFNAIEYFLETWFVSLSSLEELYLRGNKLKGINKQPMLSIDTLKVLDISLSQINHLNNNLFSKVPNLQSLDISDNAIKFLKVEMLKQISSLHEFKVDGNPVDCKDKSFAQMKRYTIDHNITYTDPCSIKTMEAVFEINNTPMKFQKMMMETSEGTTTGRSAERNKWLSETTKNELQGICNCSLVASQNGTSEVVAKSLFAQAIETEPWLVVFTAFFYGICMGMFLLCALNLVLRRKKTFIPLEPTSETYTDMDVSYVNVPNNTETTLEGTTSSFTWNNMKEKLRRSVVSSVWSSEDESLMMNQYIPDSTPMQVRRNYTNE